MQKIVSFPSTWLFYSFFDNSKWAAKVSNVPVSKEENTKK